MRASTASRSSEATIARDELYIADEVFLTGTAAEITPVREIDHRAIGTGEAGAITRVVQRAFDDALRGRSSATPSGWTSFRRARDVITVYDTTLRDGMQGEGMSLSAEEKVRLAHLLDDLGVHLVEAAARLEPQGGRAVRAARLRALVSTAEIVAFGMTRRRDLTADADPALRLLAGSFAPVVTLVGKTWGLHLDKVVRVGREENLQMIADSVAFLAGEGKRVIYDAEHFFDAFADDPEYALRCLRAAADAGASNVTLCDTNGASLPHDIAAATTAVAGALDVEIGIHCHNDAECGVANSLAAVTAGARLVQGTLNGYGERCGNANLGSTCLTCSSRWATSAASWTLAATAHYVDELLNFVRTPTSPTWARTRSRTRAVSASRVAVTPPPSSTSTPRRSATPRLADLRAAGKGPSARAERRPGPHRRPTRASSSASRCSTPRLPVRGGRRLVRPADPPRPATSRVPASPGGSTPRSARTAGSGTRPPSRSEVDGERSHAHTARSTRSTPPHSAIGRIPQRHRDYSSTTRSASSTSSRRRAHPRCSSIGVHKVRDRG